MDSKLLPDVLLGGRGRFDQLPATRRYGLAIEHSDSRNRLIAVSSSFLACSLNCPSRPVGSPICLRMAVRYRLAVAMRRLIALRMRAHLVW